MSLRFPPLPPHWPRKGNFVLRGIARSLLVLMGWRVIGQFPPNAKLLFIGGPHTSTWDAIIAIITLYALQLPLSIFAKHTLFRWPFSGLLRMFGLVPVNRQKAGGLVESAIEEFQRRDFFLLGIAPEGTRKQVEKWKTGFHRIALAAGVPILPVGLDFSTKTIQIGQLFMPTMDMDRDIVVLREFINRHTGYHPERM